MKPVFSFITLAGAANGTLFFPGDSPDFFRPGFPR
jgi:hypothetical protein